MSNNVKSNKVKLYWEGEKRHSATSRKNAAHYVRQGRAVWINENAIQFRRDDPRQLLVMASINRSTPTVTALAYSGAGRTSCPSPPDGGLGWPIHPIKVTPHPGRPVQQRRIGPVGAQQVAA